VLRSTGSFSVSLQVDILLLSMWVYHMEVALASQCVITCSLLLLAGEVAECCALGLITGGDPGSSASVELLWTLGPACYGMFIVSRAFLLTGGCTGSVSADLLMVAASQ